MLIKFMNLNIYSPQSLLIVILIRPKVAQVPVGGSMSQKFSHLHKKLRQKIPCPKKQPQRKDSKVSWPMSAKPRFFPQSDFSLQWEKFHKSNKKKGLCKKCSNE